LSWKLFEGDCLEIMPSFEDKSFDMILCDLPYGTTACKWDSIIPLEPLWSEYKRLIKDNGAIVLTASQPFTTKLISSNYDMFKYEWIWEKDNGTNFPSVNYQPFRVHENILVFGNFATTYRKNGNYNYNPQMVAGTPYECVSGKQKHNTIREGSSANKGNFKTVNKGTRYPRSIQKINRDTPKIHPTQKPVALFEYLIKTYTNENDLILDNCAGSGTTGVASYNLNRNCILIEKEPEYCDIIMKRMAELEAQPTLTAF
jgi:site-specific DNA-methyltransferase (adenine-specific)